MYYIVTDVEWKGHLYLDVGVGSVADVVYDSESGRDWASTWSTFNFQTTSEIWVHHIDHANGTISVPTGHKQTDRQIIMRKLTDEETFRYKLRGKI